MNPLEALEARVKGAELILKLPDETRQLPELWLKVPGKPSTVQLAYLQNTKKFTGADSAAIAQMITHSYNMFSEMVGFIASVAGEDNCTCADVSWAGEGHASGCVCNNASALLYRIYNAIPS